MSAISVDNLSKAYRIGLKEEIPNTVLDAAKGWVRAPFRNLRNLRRLNTFGHDGDETDDTFWALKDVSFEVEEGEVVGIIGRNGAGKSTLLKVLSRITEPTKGRAVIRGRVSSLLEVGTGFHPELSGRENIYMNGTILGMTKREIDRKFDEIVDFSGVEKFLDTPIKRYSSGMQVRLAFAVAAHLEPEILIIDEVLAVGDAEFQRKCIGKMQDVAGSGRTVLFVSHNMSAVRALCSRGVLLDEGRVIEDGTVSEVVQGYQSTIQANLAAKNSREWDVDSAPGNERFRLLGAHVTPATGDAIEIASGFNVDVELLCLEELPNLDTTLEIKTLDDAVVYHDGLVFTDFDNCRTGAYRVRFEFPGYLLNAGIYRIRLIFGQNQSYLVFKMDDVLSFEVEHTAVRTLGPRKGIIRPNLAMTADYLGDSLTAAAGSVVSETR